MPEPCIMADRFDKVEQGIERVEEIYSEKFRNLELQNKHNAEALERVAVELHGVSTDLKVLTERLGGFNQMYQDQVKGLTDLENRQTIFDKSLQELHTKLAVIEATRLTEKEEVKKQIDHMKWLIGLIPLIIGVIVFFATYFVKP